MLLCVHCSATLFVAVFGLLLAGATAPVVFGVRADILLVPLLGATLFTGWLWWGKRASSCEPAAGRPPHREPPGA